MKLDRAVLPSLPKVVLHEHLDGVLRPQTIIELARSAGYTDLPTNHPEALGEWFHQGANQGSLAKYLEGFKHTIAVMQTEEALERLTECYLAIDVKDEAQTATAVLGYNYPGSDWYQDSYNLLTSQNLQPMKKEGSWLNSAF